MSVNEFNISDLVRCENGHVYEKGLSSCPYCKDDTRKSEGTQTDADQERTRVFNSDNEESPTVGNSGQPSVSANTMVYPGPNSHGSSGSDADVFDHTVIGGSGSQALDIKPVAPENQMTRKIVGWLITYDINPMGTDHRIFEGANTIGRDDSNSIRIKVDNTISSRHARIVFRHEQQDFWIKDELSSNGTKVNGNSLDPDTAALRLKDGDELQIGKVKFKFRTAF